MSEARPWYSGPVSDSLFWGFKSTATHQMSIPRFVMPEGSMKIERIMVPMDFSRHSLVALKYAIELAREHGSEVVLLHVVEELPYGSGRWSDPTKLLEHYAETAKGELERFEKEATQIYPQCRSELHFGSVHEVVSELVSKLSVDLVVISVREQTHPFDLFIGRTAEKLFRHAPCSVLRVRTVGEPKPEN